MATTKDSWGKNECIKLIELYRKHTVLWDTTDEFYYSCVKKKDAWAEISAEMNIPIADVMKKMKSLLSSFRNQKAKGTKSMGTGKGRREIYVSKWFAFKYMLFLMDRDKPIGTVDTIHQSSESNLDHSSNGENSDLQIESDARSDDEEEYESAQASTSQEEVNVPMSPNVEPEDTQGESVARAINVADTANERPSLIGRSRRRAAAKNKDDQQLDRAFALLEKAASESSAKPQNDKHMAFALYVAEKLREYSPVTTSHVQYEINRILFAADLGQYDRPPAMATQGYGNQNYTHLLQTQPQTFHSYGSPPYSSPSHFSQPHTSSLGSPPSTSRSYFSQQSTRHYVVSPPSTTHSYETQLLSPNSYVSQPATLHLDVSTAQAPQSTPGNSFTE